MSHQDRAGITPDPELSALWRTAAETGDSAAPPTAVDARILAAARAAVASAPARRRQRWKDWLAPLSLAAVAVIGVSVTLRVADEDERRQRQEYPRDASPPAARPAEPVSAPAASRQLSGQDAASPQPAVSGERRREVPPAREAAAKAFAGAPADAARAEAVVPAPAAPAAPLAPASSRSDELTATRGDVAPRRPPADFAAKAANDGVAREKATNPQASPPEAIAESQANLSRHANPPTPRAWLARIRELRDSGKIDEARASLRRFRETYPDIPLPDDLLRDARFGARP